MSNYPGPKAPEDQSLRDQLDDNLEHLKMHPFSLSTLNELAQALTKDSTLKIRLGKNNKFFYTRTTNTITIPLNHLEKTTGTEGRTNGLYLLGVLLHEIAHKKYTNFAHIDQIMEKAKTAGLPEQCFSFLHNAFEDPRINQILIDDETVSVPIEYVYDVSWKKVVASHLPTLPKEILASAGGPAVQETLANARYKQFGHAVIYFWHNRKMMPGLRPEVVAAFEKCKKEIGQVIHTFDVKRSDYYTEDDYRQAQAESSYQTLTSEPLWSTCLELVRQDQEELGELLKLAESGSEQGMDRNSEDVPPEMDDDYIPQDLDEKEQEPGQEAPPIFTYDPEIRGQQRYCRDGVAEEFTAKTRIWRKMNKLQNLSEHELSKPKHRVTFKHPGAGKVIPIALPHGFFINPDSLRDEDGNSVAGISFYESEGGIQYIKCQESLNLSLEFGYSPESIAAPTTSASELIGGKHLTPETQNLLNQLRNSTDSDLKKASILKTHIQKKKYNVKYQAKIHAESSDSDSYIYNLDQAPELECYSANTLFVALCRQLGLESRICLGFRAKHKKHKSYLFKSEGHAWSEVWTGHDWTIVDATPFGEQGDEEGEAGEYEEEGESSGKEGKTGKGKTNPSSILNQNAEALNQDLESQIENASQQKLEENIDEKKENEHGGKPEEAIQEQTPEADPNNSEYLLSEGIYRSALRLIDPAVENTIETLSSIEMERTRKKLQSELFTKNSRVFSGLQEGDRIGLDSQSLLNIETRGTNFMELDTKRTERKIDEIQMFDMEVVVLMDISGSMGGYVNGKLTDLSKLKRIDHVFLSALAQLLICAHFKIPISFLLFSDYVHEIKLSPHEEWYDEAGKVNEKAIINSFTLAFRQTVSGGNQANNSAMTIGLKKLRDSEHLKKLLMLFSDGDVSDSPFITNENEPLLDESGAYVVAWGIGSDAVVETGKSVKGRNLRFIEQRFHREYGQPGYGRMMGVPVGNYQILLSQVRDFLYEMITEQGEMTITTPEFLPIDLKLNLMELNQDQTKNLEKKDDEQGS